MTTFLEDYLSSNSDSAATNASVSLDEFSWWATQSE